MEPVEVGLDSRGTPCKVRWRGRTFTVRSVTDTWIWRGRWWLEPTLGGRRRTYYRLACSGACLEVFWEEGQWMLSRVWD
jgi:hypothetical protein